MPRRVSVPIEITSGERRALQDLRARDAGKRSWVRAEIVLRAAGGQPNYSIAKELDISRNTVKHWRFRFARERLVGLNTRPIPGRPKLCA
ncbi:MAG: helix-turn-helix domain-containing protein [Elusimicrobia bacterium]|nr:helix-turn-helix domain-containing protein [Elusimicrobiota bacterium]